MIHPDDKTHLDSTELEELASMLDQRGDVLRDSDGLESRLFAASCELISQPKALSFPKRFTRIAMAACILIACALSVRLFMEMPGATPSNESVDFASTFDIEVIDEIRLTSTGDRDSLVLSILEARADTGFSDADLLETNDPVSIAFAPILGSGGFGIDDLATEIESIEGNMGR